MDGTGSPDYIITSDEETGEWVVAPEPAGKEKTRYATFVVKQEKPRKLPLINQPISSWKASPEWAKHFNSEKECLCLLYLEYVDASCSKGITPLSRNRYVYDKLVQSGWQIKNRRFFLVDLS